MIPSIKNHPTNEVSRLLTIQEVMTITGLKRATIYKKMNEDGFPKGLILSAACVRWKESEIADWIESLPRHR